MGIKLDFLKKTLKEDKEVQQSNEQDKTDDKKDYFLEREVETLKKRWDILRYIENSGFEIDFGNKGVPVSSLIEESLEEIAKNDDAKEIKKLSDLNLLKSLLFKKQ